jgi:hypothetical protein
MGLDRLRAEEQLSGGFSVGCALRDRERDL